MASIKTIAVGLTLVIPMCII